MGGGGEEEKGVGGRRGGKEEGGCVGGGKCGRGGRVLGEERREGVWEEKRRVWGKGEEERREGVWEEGSAGEEEGCWGRRGGRVCGRRREGCGGKERRKGGGRVCGRREVRERRKGVGGGEEGGCVGGEEKGVGERRKGGGSVWGRREVRERRKGVGGGEEGGCVGGCAGGMSERYNSQIPGKGHSHILGGE